MIDGAYVKESLSSRMRSIVFDVVCVYFDFEYVQSRLKFTVTL